MSTDKPFARVPAGRCCHSESKGGKAVKTESFSIRSCWLTRGNPWYIMTTPDRNHARNRKLSSKPNTLWICRNNRKSNMSMGLSGGVSLFFLCHRDGFVGGGKTGVVDEELPYAGVFP